MIVVLRNNSNMKKGQTNSPIHSGVNVIPEAVDKIITTVGQVSIRVAMILECNIVPVRGRGSGG